MSIAQMRDILLKKYNNSKKIQKMSDRQIFAMYSRLLNENKL